MEQKAIEEAILANFGMDRNSLYGNTLGKEKAIVSTVRSVYWVILKEEMGIPVSTIAKMFSRTPRCIYKAIAKMSWGVKNLPYYRDIFKAITEEAAPK